MKRCLSSSISKKHRVDHDSDDDKPIIRTPSSAVTIEPEPAPCISNGDVVAQDELLKKPSLRLRKQKDSVHQAAN